MTFNLYSNGLIALGIALAALVYCFHYQIRIIIQLAIVGINLKIHSRRHAKGPFSIVDGFEKDVDRFPDQEQLIAAETGEIRTKKNIDDLANQVAHWAQSVNCRAHDTAALMMLNNLDYVSIWLGFAKLGTAVALINTNITGAALAHSVETALQSSESKVFIVDEELFSSLQSELAELQAKGIRIFRWSTSTGTPLIPNTIAGGNLRDIILQFPVSRVDKAVRQSITERDALLYIFTSGTTGLPKACKISQTRFQGGSLFFPHFCLLRPHVDRIYTSLPLYHSAAGVIAMGGALRANCPLVLRKKFSVRAFSQDIITYKVTTLQYIGELCRYLTNAPPNPLDAKVKLRFALGNGMRPEYWDAFKKRYNVSFIAEFYTATEGNIGLFNVLGKPGALGFVPSIFSALSPIRLVKVDPDDPSQPLRDPHTHRCIAADWNEPGLLIGQITKGDVTRRYDGYSDSKATAQKVLKDVFSAGDSYFNTGDLLYRDIWGFYYWSDRVGDTYRWKGENVSTMEVAQALSQSPVTDFISDITVYGVQVPRTDGKAGMAAVVLRENYAVADVGACGALLDGLVSVAKKHLPVYARPLFVRLRSADRPIPVTSTLKHMKKELAQEGFDTRSQKVSPPDRVFALLYESGSAKNWIEVTEDFVTRIQKGEDVGLRL